MDYQSLALKIVPPGDRPLVGDLRNCIATTLEREVNAALTRQREAGFPELASVRKAMEDEADGMKKKLKAKQDELEAEKQRLVQWESRIKKQESELAAHQKSSEAWHQAWAKAITGVREAVAAYDAWLNGDGQVDENGKRFAALRDACKAFQERERNRDDSA